MTATVERYLSGRAIVVTGAGRGIGAAVARYLACRGAAVVVNDVDGELAETVAAQISAAGGRAIASRADVSSWDAAGELIDRCVETFSRIDGLLNNAGIVRLARPEELTEQILRKVLETNALGSAFCGVHAIRHMQRQGSGCVVNVTSGSQAGWRLMSAYAASKGAIASLTYSWAMDLKGTGIRVNAVSPVAVTRLRDHFREYLGDAYEPKPGPDADNNAAVIAYLLSERSAPLNGQVVRIDGQELSLMTHPSVMDPVVRANEWTDAAVNQAFAEHLQTAAVPLGAVPAARGNAP
jgi:NAD(P)-dependent dehydrogenase (short-subunit alcohol dehydrogenase family)